MRNRFSQLDGGPASEFASKRPVQATHARRQLRSSQAPMIRARLTPQKGHLYYSYIRAEVNTTSCK